MTARPFIKSAGGKTKLLPFIREMMPPKFRSYHEPFLGGGALFFDLAPQKAFLSDANRKLMDCYLVVRNQPSSLIERLQHFKNDRVSFEIVRKRNFEIGDIIQRAAEYIYCNKVCFNGLYRVNKSGQFNTPFGKYDNPNILNEDVIFAASAALQGAFISERRYNQAVDDMREGDFVYFDPPYEPLSQTSSFTAYTAGGFSTEDQQRLSDIALALKRRGVFVLISNSSAPVIYQLYQKPDWTIREIQAKRSINSVGEGRGTVKELLIY